MKMERMKRMEEVNPVFNTAKITLYWLAKSGEQLAEQFIKYMNIDERMIPAELISDDKRMASNMIPLEQRHRMMDRLILQTKCKNLLDLACGYTPRGVEMSARGIHYVGGDLPITIAEIKSVAEHFSKEPKAMMKYRDVDVTNYESLKQAANELDGELCIVTEGLLMYLTMDEKKVLCENIRDILLEHGGCWITQDTEAVSQFLAINIPLFGQEHMKDVMKSRAAYEKKSDSSLITNNFKTTDEAIHFFESTGLKVERIPFYSAEIPIMSLDNLPKETAEQICKQLENCLAWKITPDTQHIDIAKNRMNEQNTPFKFTMDVDGTELVFTVEGRLDTLSAPELLRVFEEKSNEQSYDRIRIDMKSLEYISSAGLRVLLMMSKAQKGCTIFVENVNESVREVFASTGFDSIFEIE